MNFNTLEEKCRYYQSLTDYRLIPNSYVLIHCDGRSFSKLIKNNFEKPFDKKFISFMNETAKFLCENVCGCKLSYVQSDEITLVLTDFDDIKTDSFFGYRLSKITSITASMATAKFNRLLVEDMLNTPCSINDMKSILNDVPLINFDCKAWNVPTFNDVKAWIIYRQNDCVRNSILQTAHCFFNQKELNGLKTNDVVEKLIKEKNIKWEYFPDNIKYGRFIIKNDKWEIINGFHITKNIENFNHILDIPIIEKKE